MRFESVTAYAFGRLRDETLQLAPGMNVIWGPNEAGKSTWHAALYAGLCGMRRGRGRARAEDSDFQARHKPWEGEDWEVGATIALNGRRATLRHDLDGRVDSSARDADLAGRDYSSEIMNDGAPDGARWLGLDRRSFLSTACVRQTSILAVLDDPGDLQDELQSAAATARTGETAADALGQLNAYRAEQVGTERAPSKPLAQSQQAARSAQDELASARSAHAEAAERRHSVEALDAEVQRLEQEANATRAALAETAAESAEQRLARARKLSASFPGGAPRRPSEEDELAQEVARSLATWDARPAVSGTPISELQHQLNDVDQELAGPPRRGLVALLRAIVRWFARLLGLTPRVSRPEGSELAERRRRIEMEIDDVSRVEEAAIAIRNAALSTGLPDGSPDALAQSLRRWQQTRAEQMGEADERLDDWEELQRLLGERTLVDLEEETRGLRSEADSLIANSVQEVIAEARAHDPSKGDLDGLEASLRSARTGRDRARGELTEFESGLPDVAEAEERLERAAAELARVQRLDQTLGTAITFLEAAQERVHRDIAPVLRATVLERLDQVTGSRYVDCRIDPESLEVEVADRDGRWRRAGLLSHGTAEQLYLLLRLALARHLTKPSGEVCPLILDDVVSAADSERKRQLLETLLPISESVQVILFTHEDDVRSWAEKRLTGAMDRLTVLAGEPRNA